jgi:large subunit ribosomal protein L31
MKQGIHPTYYTDARVTCASCGSTWTTGSTQKDIRVEICSKCHPFFSGEQARIVDIEGQVDRFYKKLQARQTYVDDKQTRAEAKVSPKRPIAELELSTRAVAALEKAGITERRRSCCAGD